MHIPHPYKQKQNIKPQFYCSKSHHTNYSASTSNHAKALNPVFQVFNFFAKKNHPTLNSQVLTILSAARKTKKEQQKHETHHCVCVYVNNKKLFSASALKRIYVERAQQR